MKIDQPTLDIYFSIFMGAMIILYIIAHFMGKKYLHNPFKDETMDGDS